MFSCLGAIRQLFNPLQWTKMDILHTIYSLSRDPPWTFYWPPPISSCSRSYWMTPKMLRVFSSEFITIQMLCLNLKCWVGEGKIVGSVRTYERHMNELLFKLFFKCHGQKSKPWKILVNLAVLVWPHFSRTVWHILQ